MSLKIYYGKNALIYTANDTYLKGVVEDYFFPEDNEDNRKSIVISTRSGEIIELNEDDIMSISVKNSII